MKYFLIISELGVSKISACAFLILTVLGLASAPSRSEEQNAANPPIATISRPAGGLPTAVALGISPDAPSVPSSGGEASLSVNIDYTDATILNRRTGLRDKVRLRSYQGAGSDPAYPFVAPTISLYPGETFRITLDNKLPQDDPSCGSEQDDPNIPHCFNSTNLHAHGLWVSPAGNSDNVLLRINPGVKFEYEYNIPADHPAGTYWYHPHLHGSTALQVSSGMAGALIVRGTRLPVAGQPGDIDTLLRLADGSAFPERILLLQQIPYACRDAAGRIKTDPPGADDGVWVCDPGEVGKIEAYDGPVRPDQFGPPAWRASGRYTTINGRTVPTWGASAGQIERWRLIHAGVRDSVMLSFQKVHPTQVAMAVSANYTGATPDARAAFVDQTCDGQDLPHHVFANDGLTRERIVGQEKSILYPGYREDLLVVFPEPGLYCVVDNAAPADANVNQQEKSRQLLGWVSVGEGPRTGGLSSGAYIKQELKAAAARFMPAGISQQIVADLEQNLLLRAFVPHESIKPEDVTGKQTVSFSINAIDNRTVFQIGKLNAADQPVDLKPYAPQRIDRTLQLGAVEEWRLKSFVVGHPFHIHVNPFQIASVLEGTLENPRDVSGFEPGNQSEWARLKGVWKDTLFIAGRNRAFVVRSRYRRYIGDFVLHCHILDHEDQGMMENVRVALPDGRGGIASGHH